MTDTTPQPKLTCNGHELKALASAGLSWLDSHHHHVNELNVFPVPDGDTGTNMLLTMRNAYKEVTDDTSIHVGRIVNKIAHGAMMGSRGNSGTIMSQLWLGFARTVGEADTFDAKLLAKGLREATETAYRGVQRPVEGTILTVAREMTEEVESLIHSTQDLIEILDKMVIRGWQAVEKTPEFLPVLKKAGVVDSGGTGLVYVLEGMLRYLRGQTVITEQASVPTNIVMDEMHDGPQIEHPGENIYDVQFVIKGTNLNAPNIKAIMEQMGDSVVVVGAETAVKVHVHVRNPGLPLEYAANVGPISDIVVENMLEQYEEYLRDRFGGVKEDTAMEFVKVEPGQIAVVAVAAGQGIASIFHHLGVSNIVEGGQTNNPSTEEILKSIQALDTDKFILLPNNKNIILSAEQVAKLATDRQIKVVPTRTFPQGVATMFAYKPDGDLQRVYEAMLAAKDEVITAEVTVATRTVELDGVNVKTGQVIGLLDGQLRVAGDEIDAVVRLLLEMVDLDAKEIVTLYFGDTITEDQAIELGTALGEEYADLEFDVVFGGQSHYPYILSIE